MRALFLFVIMASAVFATVYDVPTFPTKVENDKNGSLRDIVELNEITPSGTTHTFYMEYLKPVNPKKAVALADFSFKKGTSLKGVESIGVVSVENYQKEFQREICTQTPVASLYRTECYPQPPKSVCGYEKVVSEVCAWEYISNDTYTTEYVCKNSASDVYMCHSEEQPDECYQIEEKQPDMTTCKNETYYLPYTRITTDEGEKELSSKYSKYLIRYKTNNWVADSFNFTDFDPDTDACGTLSTANGLYTLNTSVTANGSTCFTITAPNVVLDCNGFSITGNNSTNTYGVYTSQLNTTVRNCQISNFGSGIYANGGNNGVVTNTTVLTTYTYAGSSSGHGIILSSNWVVSNVNVTSTSSQGLYLVSGSNNNTIANSTVNTSAATGIRVSVDSYNNRIINTTVYSASTASAIYHDGGGNLTIDCQGASIIGSNVSATYGVYSSRENTTVQNCNISNFSTGIFTNTAPNSLFINNTVSSNTPMQIRGNDSQIINNTVTQTATSTYGIVVDGVGVSSNITIDCGGRSILGNNASGTFGVYSSQLTTRIRNCNISDFATGISLATDAADNALIANNTINITYSTSCSRSTGVCAAIAVNAADNALISQNNITGTTNAITVISSADGTLITQNRVACGNEGIALNIGNSNTNVTQNTITATTSGGYGILMYSPSASYVAENVVVGTAYGIAIRDSDLHTVHYNNITAGTGGFWLYSSPSDGNSVKHNRINITSSSGAGLRFTASAHKNSVFYNNTITQQYAGGTAIYSASDANISNMTFYGNNITTTNWVNLVNGSGNNFNQTGVGNIYYFANGTPSWQVYNITSSTAPNWADGGANRPFSGLLTQWSGAGDDWYPYTEVSGTAGGEPLDCGNLSTPNTIYNMSYDLYSYSATCFTITAPNVTLDCKGFTILGSNSSATYGVYSTRSNTTVRNCQIDDFARGINLDGSSSSNILNNTINTTFNNTGYGVVLSSSSSVFVSSNNISVKDVSYGIVAVSNSHNVNLENNSISVYGTGTAYGMSLTGGQNISVDCKGANIMGSNSTGTYGIYMTQLNTTVQNCQISNFSRGISLASDAADNALVQNNTINLTYSTSCSATTGPCQGIFSDGADFMLVTKNRISSYAYAIALDQTSTNNVIEGNDIFNSSSGIYARVSSTIFANNSINVTSYGIFFDGSTVNFNNTIDANRIYVSSIRGIFFDSSTSNTSITNNNVTAINDAIYTNANVVNLMISSNRINTTTTGGIRFPVASGGNHTIFNNTINTPSGAAVSVLPGSSTFYQNNITGQYWVLDQNGTNFYNTTLANGTNVGNIYYFTNGTGAWEVFDIQSTTAPNWSDRGSKRPFNSTNAPTVWTDYGEDWHPWTQKGALDLNWTNQTPNDISSLNVIDTPLYIQYVITAYAGLVANNSTMYLCYKTNNSLNDISAYNNGTADIGFECDIQGYNQTATLYNFTLYDNEVYPHTENVQDSLFRTLPHNTTTTLTSANDYHSVQYMNVSKIAQYGFWEAYFDSTTATGVRIYTCNSTYTVGKVDTSPNCAQIASVVANGAYNHSHADPYNGSIYSYHRVVPYAIDNTTNTINGIKVTGNMTLHIRGNAGAVVTLYGISIAVRPDAEKYSSNGGSTWSNEIFSTDSHLHQYDGVSTFYYFACINTTTGVQYCSYGASNRSDMIEFGDLPPTPPTVYSPSNTTYTNGSTILINFSAALSPSGANITSYNITLNTAYGVFVQNINGNIYPNTSYNWTTTGVPIGNYVIKVTACNNYSACSNGTSAIFTLAPQEPQITADISFHNATAGHWFFANATASSDAGGAWINQLTATTTSGSCVYYNSSASGAYMEVLFNCSSTVPANTTVLINFTDTYGRSNTTSGANEYPDHNASLTTPTIEPNPAGAANLLTCLPGNFSDPDGDIEDTAARTWRWYLNGSIIVGETSQTLAPGPFDVTDIIGCFEETVAVDWTASNASAYSANITIQPNSTIRGAITYPLGSFGDPYRVTKDCFSIVVFESNITNLSSAIGTVCSAYYQNGTFYSSQNTTVVNGQFNFSFNNSGVYGFNCTMYSVGDSSNTQTTWVNIESSGLCPTSVAAGTDAVVIALIMLGFVLLYFAGSWEKVHPFLAPLSNLVYALGLFVISLAVRIMGTMSDIMGSDIVVTITVYAIYIFCFYLMLRCLAMCWVVLKAVMWKK